MARVAVAVIVLILLGGITYVKLTTLSLVVLENVSAPAEYQLIVEHDPATHDESKSAVRTVKQNGRTFFLYMPKGDANVTVECRQASTGQSAEIVLGYVTTLINDLWIIRADACKTATTKEYKI